MRRESIASDKAFVDTNILVYAQDPRDPEKRETAIQLVDELSASHRMVVSVQVLNELCAVLLRSKIGEPVDYADLMTLAEEISASAEVIDLTPAITQEALRAVAHHSISFYDALIWAAARTSGCTVIYTEDQPGANEIEGIRYLNPFSMDAEDTED